jgi:glycosyltransferase involved in cell wall biosynthesis
LDKRLYEPVVLFYTSNPYASRFKAIGVRVINLCEHELTAAAVSSGSSRPGIAARLSHVAGWLSEIYLAVREVYVLMQYDRPWVQRVVRLLKDERIDLVHHNNSLSSNRATVIAAWLTNVPQVCHVRGLSEYSWVERCLVRSVDAFIYISEAVAELYGSLGVPQNKGHVIYNPVNVGAFESVNPGDVLRSEFGLDNQTHLISNVGRLDWWKGHDYFLQAMAKVVQSYPNTKALIVGTPDMRHSSQAYYQRLQKLVTDLRLSEHVVFTGFRTDIPDIMAASDIVVHSASEPEPFGRVIVEAMASARPVIATAAGGVLEIIEDQVDGLLVPPQDDATMAEAIEHLLQNKGEAEVMGQRARQSVKKRFSVARHTAAVQELYQKILLRDADSRKSARGL